MKNFSKPRANSRSLLTVRPLAVRPMTCCANLTRSRLMDTDAPHQDTSAAPAVAHQRAVLAEVRPAKVRVMPADMQRGRDEWRDHSE